ncbi:MAG: ABC transporter ATP-binding protein [Cyclobacteriaceae bacterium]
MLKVENLSKSYQDKETPAVDGVSFFLPPQSVIGVFGKSGSGKSTLLKMIAGLIQPDKGNVFLQDNRIKGPAEKLVPGHDEIKLVFQDFKLKHRMTVRENINSTLLSYEKDYRQVRLEKVIDLCILRDIERKPIESLSGGQQQRVAIARALANEPLLLLMDEPFSNLDITAKAILKKVIRNIIAETMGSIIFVSHDPDEVLSLSDQIVVLDDGKAVQFGTPKEIYNQPVNVSVAEMFSRVFTIRRNGSGALYRTEALSIGDNSRFDLHGTVSFVEFLGRSQLLTIMTEDNSILFVTDFLFRYQKGDTIYLLISGEALLPIS